MKPSSTMRSKERRDLTPPGHNGTLGAGQRLTTLYPDGTVSRVEYDVKGRVIHEWGSAGYPVEHEFDPVYGDRIKLRTYRSGTGWDGVSWPGAGATADVTEWVYQGKTGLLMSKKDAANLGVSYSYQDTASYRLASRAWVRSPSVLTTYTYDSNTGELTGISYNDGTPGVTRGYDRAGRLTSVTDAAGSRTLSYSALNELDDEQFGAGQFSGLVLDHGFDAYGRPTSLAGGTNFTSVGIAYRAEGRVDKVTSGTLAWTYSYEANSDRISQVQSKDGTVVKVTQKRGYDILGQLEQIEEQFLNGTVVERQVAGYSYDAMHRRRQKVLEDGSVWSYRYNERGEVVSGKRSWLGQTLVAGQQFEYEYDSIGNRTRALKGGDASGNGLRAEVYSPTALNQYSQITLANAVDVVGIAYGTVGVTVSVNGGVATAAARQGEYYQLAATMGTTGTPTSNRVSVATSAGGAASVGSVYRPPLIQDFVHDADGNLISDGLWKYAWDAENRIRVMYMTNLAAGTPRFQLEFQYDYQGRRIRKTVKARQHDPAGTNWVVWSDRRFIYEGWNLMAELDALNANTMVRSYVWGQDLAGGLGTQGGRKTAGGIGGALATRTLSSGSDSLYCYDGNGNVVGLVDATTQTWAARYEYGPFGELIRASGALAKSNPFRFSTKYQDDESELLYYGYRFYNASTGRWISRDPSQEMGGLNLYNFVLNEPISILDYLGLGSWKVENAEIDLEAPDVSVKAKDPSGFQVTYVPDPGECKDGRIVVYQIVSTSGFFGTPPHVDCSYPTPGIAGCNLPGTGRLLRGDTFTSYKDSPGDRNRDGILDPSTFRFTSVATCRNKCKEKVLGTYYFEFDNKSRKLKLGGINQDHFKDGIADWKANGGQGPE